CPIGVPSDKLICLIPQVYGVNGLPIKTSGPGITPHFQNVLPDSLRPLNSAIARESAVLPLASPSSGISFSWDSTANVFVPSTDSFGPILGDRAETVGRSKAFLGFSYQYFNFDNIDGINLGNLPSVFLQQDDKTTISGVPRTCSVTGDSTSGCGYIRDVVTTTNKVGLTVHQFTTFITFGVTSRVDVSAAIPIETVRMSVLSNATIVNNSNSTGATFAHTFDFRPGCGNLATSTPCANQSFS